ncbi:hypothetical protein GWK47_038221 [Chionoecetes opilio]|uniref:Uncharacterized protein n=1 Tax=Chionoecetes opilio TaxID=41210 RepID=A0A8J4YCW6_CHIOP|nr:hypothetical protein GWK47_038221 [Chionoecetes opilio]
MTEVSRTPPNPPLGANQLSLWRYSEILLLAPGVSPSRRIIQTASVQEGGEGCAGVAFTPYLRRLTYAFLLDLAPESHCHALPWHHTASSLSQPATFSLRCPRSFDANYIILPTSTINLE